jgi:uncharacterized membrane protein YdjX (TVP38/TMEM64 family)
MPRPAVTSGAGSESAGLVNRSRLVKLAVATALVVVVCLALRRTLGLEFDPASLRRAVEGMGVWAPLVYIGVVAFRVPLGLPSQLVLVGGGLVFGTAAGTLYGAIGIVLSALVLFLASRWAGRDALEARLPRRLRPILEIAASPVGAVFMAVGTGYPLGPITMYHLVGGVTGMPLPLFAVAVVVGGTIRAATFAFFGSSLLAGEFDLLLRATGVLILSALAPLAFARPRAWLLQAIGSGARDRAPSGGDWAGSE